MEESIDRICGPRVMKTYLDKVTGPKLEEIGLTPAAAPFIGAIAHNEGVSMKGLTEMLMVDKAHTTRTVTKLIEMRLVENRADGHEYSLYMTEEGKKKAVTVNKIVEEAWESLFRDVTQEEKDVLNTILQKISNVIKEADI